MLRPALLTLVCLALVCACVDDPADDASSEAEAGDGDGDTNGDGDGDTNGDGDGETNGDGDGETEPPPVPAQLPSPTGSCPSFTSGTASFSPDGIDARNVKLWVGDNPQPGGMLIIYWHAYGSAPDEAPYALSQPVVDAILDQGGVIAAPYPASDVGEFPWFVVNNSPRQDDMLLGDEIVACALEQVGVDPRRLHTSGMSAGGLQTVAFTMARSRYIASTVSFSGGAYQTLPFEDPSNLFAAMIVHGGDNDIFGGLVNFKTLSLGWYNQLVDGGHFAFLCDHGDGHSLPTGYGASVANFFFAHPFGTAPSPYAGGLPNGFPADCSL